MKAVLWLVDLCCTTQYTLIVTLSSLISTYLLIKLVCMWVVKP